MKAGSHCSTDGDEDTELETELERLLRLCTSEVVGAGVHGADALDWGW